MSPSPCATCGSRALIIRPKNHQKLCKACFIRVFEDEIHNTIITHKLFAPGECVAIGASGGKDSTVLASVLTTLNQRHHYALNLVLLSIDEGISGYRDDSLETVKHNAVQYGLPLHIVGYAELYGWTMDQVVAQIGKRGNCTYCGVFRRQALDRGAAQLGIKHVVTGHNADDIAETVMMNLLRGDLPRLARATGIMTGSSSSLIRRSKPLKYAYEKEIVLYAHHRNLEYFTTECIYSPEAFRGSARTLIKNLERIRPSAILDVVRSGEDMAKLVPPDVIGIGCVDLEDDTPGACGSASERSSGGEMSAMEKHLQAGAANRDLEIEVVGRGDAQSEKPRSEKIVTPSSRRSRRLPQQSMGKCVKCGYLSSQEVCKACLLLEGLNKNRPKLAIRVDGDKDGVKRKLDDGTADSTFIGMTEHLEL